MDQSNTTRFDFDHWAALAREDPEGFESARQQAIESAIGRTRTDRQQRLRRLQWKLDQIRQLSHTPLLACLRMNRLMWDSVCGEDGLLSRLQRPAIPAPRQQKADILPFRH